MPSVREVLSGWARRTTSSFTELWVLSESAESSLPPAGEPIFRLRGWPVLPDALKTAAVYRTLSVMSHRPVNRRWIVASTRMKPEQVDQLLQRLIELGVVEVIDPSQFGDTPGK
jgi:hypothetical protein